MLYGCFAAAYVVPTYRDIKPASQVMVEKQDFGTPIASAATTVLSSVSGPTTGSATTVSTFAAQPDVARNLFLTPGGTTGDVESCAAVVTGTNILGRAVSETFTILANQTSATVGAKAFKTVSSVSFPANCESGTFAATWSLGVGEKIGLKRCMDNAGAYLHSVFAGAKETSSTVVVGSTSAVEQNTVDLAGTMDGSARFYGYFFQNFSCLP